MNRLLWRLNLMTKKNDNPFSVSLQDLCRKTSQNSAFKQSGSSWINADLSLQSVDRGDHEFNPE